MSASLWQEYVAAHPEHREEQPPVDAFGDSAAMADELLELVLTGPKRATAGPLAAYEFDGESIPVAGSHWVATDGSGAERVVLRTVEVWVGPLDSVDDAFAYDEGEGDRTREYWLDVHRRFFSGQAEQRGIPTPDGPDSMACVFERFEVVWPPEHADGG
ncbi:ASCH domain-containing protein [Aeromicrobium sp.]|uniref:ASCH domain-containing protein n=1 Tax=Aeromicrobium sp. TaxID=1871063 RepID=UPI003D6AA6E3